VLFDDDENSADENSRITKDYALITRISTSGFVEVNLSGCRAYGQMAFWFVLKNLEFYRKVLPDVEGKDFQILLQVNVEGKTCTGWDILAIRPGPEPATPRVDFPSVPAPETITWLHLSDLHFRDRSDNEIYNSNIVLDALLEDIEKLRSERALAADFIVVTGDIAYSGKPAQYEQAEKFFEKLLEATNLQKKQLFLVPGNHDVDRKAISPFTNDALHTLSNHEKVNEFLKDKSARALVFEKLRAYNEFVRTYFQSELIFDDEGCFYVKILPVREKNIALLGLNSAWLCGLDSAKDRASGLLLGERQVHSAAAQTRNADLCIALMHHPLDWLKDFDQNKSKKILSERCDFILHGHTHQPQAQQLLDSKNRPFIIATGASYQGREYPNRYNFVQLSPSKCKVLLRLYSDESFGHWAKDVETYKNAEDGTYDFDCQALSRKDRG